MVQAVMIPIRMYRSDTHWGIAIIITLISCPLSLALI